MIRQPCFSSHGFTDFDGRPQIRQNWVHFLKGFPLEKKVEKKIDQIFVVVSLGRFDTPLVLFFRHKNDVLGQTHPLSCSNVIRHPRLASLGDTECLDIGPKYPITGVFLKSNITEKIKAKIFFRLQKGIFNS